MTGEGRPNDIRFANCLHNFRKLDAQLNCQDLALILQELSVDTRLTLKKRPGPR